MSAMTAFPLTGGSARGALIASPSSALRERASQSLNGRWRPVQHAVSGADALVKLETGEWQGPFVFPPPAALHSPQRLSFAVAAAPGVPGWSLHSSGPLRREQTRT